MKLLVKKSFVNLIGQIWMPGLTAAGSYPLDSYAISNMTNEEGTITRDDVELWLCLHTGDFRSIQDFEASIELGEETLTFNWANEESELTFWDCTEGGAE